MPNRRLLLLLAPLLLGGCPLANMADAVNQLAMTPEPGTFNHIDCNMDGRLGQDEASARVFLRTRATPGLHNVTAEEFSAGDTDRSGYWSYEEFRSVLTGATAWSVSPTDCGPTFTPPTTGG